MFECHHCNLFFKEKKLLAAHQKTKKCTMHRDINFQCKKCFVFISGYDNIMAHQCNEQTDIGDSSAKLINSLIEQLKKFDFDIDFKINDSFTNGHIIFKKMNNYQHPTQIDHGLTCPQKLSLYQKIGTKEDNVILGGNNLYLNNIFFKILHISDSFQILASKYPWNTFVDILWFNSPPFSIFSRERSEDKENIYVLGKVQSEDKLGQKWYSDTFDLKEGENVHKLVCTKIRVCNERLIILGCWLKIF
ncbi:hypothetical protein DH26_gp083 [Chloriridovirus anopheles1]|uniref:Uncharacterized protein n=1 Tax=Chloriridovirus anopheles1 TaxID=1465751 RepID=W8R9P4_9VIRU|nr:hypothetical protein DH26_gp083 [Anopheles minimus iridovirus]AHL67576.1 hypothetical protein AMIV_083 [Anopheles minimus iridovirus]